MSETKISRDENAARTPTPSDWEHCKILMARSLRKDMKKPTHWMVRFVLPTLLFMLYTIGVYFSYIENPGVTSIPGDYRFFPAKNWTVPAAMHLGGLDSDFVAQVADNLNNTSAFNTQVNLTQIENSTLFSEECSNAITDVHPQFAVCVYFHDDHSYDIIFGDGEPSQKVLAGAQWAINTVLLLDSNTFYPVDKIQRAPIIIESTDISLEALLIPTGMFVLSVMIMTQFLVGPITYEKLNHVAQ
jgi:hypothetical protein